MKTKLTAMLSATLLALMLSSCPETTVSNDFGLTPLKLDKAEWEGTWIAAGKPAKEGFVFEVTDAANGGFEARGTGKDDKPLVVRIHEAGGTDKRLCFLIYTDKASNKRGPLHLISRPKDNRFVLWGPNHGEIAQGVKSGELKGTLVKGDKDDHQHTELDTDPANYAKLLDPRYWNWTDPDTFVRSR